MSADAIELWRCEGGHELAYTRMTFVHAVTPPRCVCSLGGEERCGLRLTKRLATGATIAGAWAKLDREGRP